MCRPQKEKATEAEEEQPQPVKDEHGYVSNINNSSAAAEELATTWCCGMLNMEPPKTGRELGVWEKSLEDQSNWLTWITLSYLHPMLKLGSRKVLEMDDIGVVSEQDRSRAAYERVKECWESQIRKTEAANAFQKLHNVAVENNRSFEELCTRALGSADEKDDEENGNAANDTKNIDPLEEE